MGTEQFFYANPVFSFDTFYNFKYKNESVKRASVYQLLQYYIRTHKIILLRKELYAVVPPHLISSNEEPVVDPYLIAAAVSADSVIAYHSALELHGVSYSNFQRFTFLTNRKIKPFNYKEQLFQPVAQVESLKKLNKENVSVLTENRLGMTLRLTSLARTYVDVLSRPELCGGWEEVCRSVANIASVDIDEMVSYCLLLDSPVLCAKVGFFLEKRSDAFVADKNLLNKLLLNRPKSPYYLIQHDHEPAKFVKKWNLMVPDRIINNRWEEPNYDI